MPSRRAKWTGLIIAIVIAAAGTAGAWLAFRGDIAIPPEWLQNNGLPENITSGNGRLEATEVDVATQLPGRLAEVLFQEGDMVEAGQVVARLDVTNLQAQLRQAQAEQVRATRDREYAEAVVAQRESEMAYAQRELERLQQLEKRSFISADQLDEARTGAHTAEAALRAAQVRVAETEAAITAAEAQADRIQADLDDAVLKAPRSGRVLYRLAEPGEVLGAGGKVLTLLDLTDVYMIFFLPETVVGRVAINAEARLVLDAGPEYVIPAHIAFVAARAQFTPKQVETRSEREKLAFRVKARVDPDLLQNYEPLIKTGLPGIAYVSLKSDAPWPDWLEPKLPPWPPKKSTSPD